MSITTESEARIHAVGKEPAPGRALLEAAGELTARICADFSHMPDATTVATPLQEVLDKRQGVCQDFARFAIDCLRGLGFAARYVSGYLETVPPSGQARLRDRPGCGTGQVAGQARLKGANATHAWFAVYVPGSDGMNWTPPTMRWRGRAYRHRLGSRLFGCHPSERRHLRQRANPPPDCGRNGHTTRPARANRVKGRLV